MKKLFVCLFISFALAACATLPGGKACPATLELRPFFAQEERLAAFDFRAHIQENELDGILQIKKLGQDRYEVQAFAKAGAYRLLQAEITAGKIEYKFLVAAADRAAVKAKISRFLRLMLFTSSVWHSCHLTKEGYVLTYKKPYPVSFKYTEIFAYPVSISYRKIGKDAVLDFLHYLPNGPADQLAYQDGVLQMQLKLIRLKK